MELKELSHEQQVALVALVEALAVADRRVTEEEEQEINSIADALGDETYRRLLDEAERRFPDEQRLRAFLVTITDQDACDLLFETALEVAAIEPPFGTGRSELLDWLTQTWNIQIDVEGTGEA